MTNNIIDVTSDNFVESVIKGSEKLPVVVDFWAPWCSPCKQLTPIIENAVNAHSDKVILAKINIEENHATLAQHTFQHELTVAAKAGMLGSIDANRGDYQNGWDTDQFPMNLSLIHI